MGFDSESGEVAAVESSPVQPTLFDKSTGSMGSQPEVEIRQKEAKIVNLR